QVHLEKRRVSMTMCARLQGPYSSAKGATSAIFVPRKTVLMRGRGNPRKWRGLQGFEEEGGRLDPARSGRRLTGTLAFYKIRGSADRWPAAITQVVRSRSNPHPE